MNDTNKTYIHNGTEVVLTGRTATKKKKRAYRSEDDTLILHEIKPVDKKIDMTDWVCIDDLYEVVPKD